MSAKAAFEKPRSIKLNIYSLSAKDIEEVRAELATATSDLNLQIEFGNLVLVS